MQNVIDLINFGNGVQALAVGRISGAYTSPQYNFENLTDTCNVILAIGNVPATTSGFQCWLEETQYSGAQVPAGATGVSGWVVVSGCSFPATSGNVLGTTASGGSAVSGNLYIGRGLRNYQFARFNVIALNGLSGATVDMAAIVVDQGKYIGTSGASLSVNVEASLSGKTGFYGAGSDRWPSS